MSPPKGGRGGGGSGRHLRLPHPTRTLFADGCLPRDVSPRDIFVGPYREATTGVPGDGASPATPLRPE